MSVDVSDVASGEQKSHAGCPVSFLHAAGETLPHFEYSARCRCGKVFEIGNVLYGNELYMPWSDRLDIQETEHKVVLIDDFSSKFPASDSAEHTTTHAAPSGVLVHSLS
jgi:hypothetical protein